MMVPLSWVVGAGGLLGSSTVAAIARSGPVWSPMTAIRWSDADADVQLARATRAFLTAAGRRPWQIAWCAGAGVTVTTAAELRREADVFDSFLRCIDSQTAGANRDGALFVASSAGGVYAGSRGAPFAESSAVTPISPYGHAKLQLENAAIRWSKQTGIALVVGRISNIYGPSQNLAKSQGLISQICRAHLLHQPISIYVPLDTVRDYIFAADCGALVADSLVRLRDEVGCSGATVHTKILASQQGVTVGFLVAELRRVFKRAPKIVYGTSANSRFQVRDLRFRSVVWPELDRRSLTPLPAGMSQTIDGLTRALQASRLSAAGPANYAHQSSPSLSLA